MDDSLELGRDFDYGRGDFEKVRQMLYQRAGISLSDSKEQMVYSRLIRRLRNLNLTSFREYFEVLARDAEEWEQFVNALTTNLTSFFRENHHFEHLAQFLRERAGERRTLRIWSSASSTGEEPYSLAITSMEAFNSLTPPVRILASDIDTKVLEAASQGVYQLNRLEQLPLERKRRFFLRGTDANLGKAKVREELRQLIDFRQINLLDSNWGIEPGLDAIFCRNVMIYFDKPTQLRVLERMVRLLRPDGLFFAGHSESFVHAGHVVRLIGRTIYRPVQGGN